MAVPATGQYRERSDICLSGRQHASIVLAIRHFRMRAPPYCYIGIAAFFLRCHALLLPRLLQGERLRPKRGHQVK